jgi:hypothetical protein
VAGGGGRQITKTRGKEIGREEKKEDKDTKDIREKNKKR